MKTTPYKCPTCSEIQPTGTFKQHRRDKPFRVLYSDFDGKQTFVEATTLEVARGFACGKPSAVILTGVKPTQEKGGAE